MWITNDLGSLDIDIVSIGSQPWDGSCVKTADIDNDGDKDVIVSSSSFDDNIRIWENQVGNPISFIEHDPGGVKGQYEIEIGDINNDGDLDIFFTTYGFSEMYYLRNDAPITTTILEHPMDQTLCEGEIVEFMVHATGESLTYRWTKNDENIIGATQDVITIDNVSSEDAGSYKCIVTGTGGEKISDPAVLIVNTNVVIDKQPESIELNPGESVLFDVEATGTITSFQWLKNNTEMNDGGHISGSQTNELSISNVSNTDEGMYKCLVTGECNSSTSEEVALSIKTGLEVIGQNDIKIVPNPAIEYFSIISDKIIKKVEIVNVAGKIVKSYTNHLSKFDVSSLNTGIYLVNIAFIEGGSICKKVVID